MCAVAATRRARRSRRVLAGAVLALLVWPSPGQALSLPAPSVRVAAVSMAAADTVEDETGSAPSQSDLEAQQALVDQLRRTAARTGDQLAAAEAQLKAASVLAASALEAYSTANRAALAADFAESQARDDLLRARLDAEQARRSLGEWARAAYRGSGGDAGGSSTLLALLQGLPTDDVANAFAAMQRIWVDIEELETRHGLPVTGAPDAGMAWSMHRWASGRDLDEVLRGQDMGAGDFVRRCKQVVDLLGQVATAADDAVLRRTARRAVDVVLRGVVATDRLD